MEFSGLTDPPLYIHIQHPKTQPQHLYDRFRIDSSLHLDPALLPPPSSSADAPQQQGKEKDENEDEALSAFLLALQRAWGGLVHVCIVSDGEGGGAPPSKARPQVRAWVRAWSGLGGRGLRNARGMGLICNKRHTFFKMCQATAARFVRAFLAHGFARVSYLEVGLLLFVFLLLCNYGLL